MDFSSTFFWIIIITVSLLSLIAGMIAASLFTRNRSDSATQSSKQSTALQQRNAANSRRLANSDMRELYKMLSGLSATLNYQRVLDLSLDLSLQALSKPGDQSEKLICAVFLFSEGNAKEASLYVGAARRFTLSDMKGFFPAQKGILREVIDEGGAILYDDIATDPELGRVLALQACNSSYFIPLKTGFDIYGVLLFANHAPAYFTPERCELLDIIGNQAMIAIQNARLYQDLEQEKERMMEIQEETRKKLARDLHDGPTQSIAAIAMRVNFARRLMERDAKAAADELYKIEDLARRTTKEIRHMLFTLRPLVLESQGLQAAFESMAEKIHETYGQVVRIEVDPETVSELEMGKQGVIFYIAEEAVTNARKHADAETIWVRLKSIDPEVALLEIQDNGVGFDVGAVDASYEHRGSLGMINMRERTELVNGIINIESKPGEGACIRVIIPLTEEATERIQRGV